VTKAETHDQLTIRKTAQEINTNINNCDLSERRPEHESLSQNVNQKSERQPKHERRYLLKLSARLLEPQGLSEKYCDCGPPARIRNEPKCPIQGPWDQRKKIYMRMSNSKAKTMLICILNEWNYPLRICSSKTVN
jgi:hypothetical protein